MWSVVDWSTDDSMFSGLWSFVFCCVSASISTSSSIEFISVVTFFASSSKQNRTLFLFLEFFLIAFLSSVNKRELQLLGFQNKDFLFVYQIFYSRQDFFTTINFAGFVNQPISVNFKIIGYFPKYKNLKIWNFHLIYSNIDIWICSLCNWASALIFARFLTRLKMIYCDIVFTEGAINGLADFNFLYASC